MNRKWISVMLLLIFSLPALLTSCTQQSARSTSSQPLSLLPKPKSVKGTVQKDGMYTAYKYNPTYTCTDESFYSAAAAFSEYGERLFGITFTEAADGEIRIAKDPEIESSAYRLVCREDGVTLSASDTEGINHGFASLLQMMEKMDNGVSIPRLEVTDRPDSDYRGMMVDIARNWHDISFLYDYVDMCYYYKLSVLHLHFTDSQSYTLPCTSYPELPTENRHYTKEEIASLVEYAYQRGIELMPEIDIPGHCEPFQQKYPRIFGTSGIICQHEESFQALREIFNELCALFPHSKYIHIGGDEAAIQNWLKCNKCKKYAESQGIDADGMPQKLASEQMYAHFIMQIADVVFQNGRIPVAWEGFAKEVNDMVSKEILMMSWENYYQPTPDLLEGGFRIINCSWVPMYVVTPNTHWSQEAVFNWNIYSWKPVHGGSPYLDGLTVEPTDQVMGGQLLAWGDAIMTAYADNLEEGIRQEQKLLLERLPALAENTWNVADKEITYEAFTAAYEEANKDLAKILRNFKNQ